MKKLILNIIAIATVVIIFNSCDYVDNALPPATQTTGGPVSTIIYRKALVEDYTGHKCGNCPAAAVELTSLEASYPNKIVPIAVHAGFFANVSTAYPTDFRTADGTAYDNAFGNSTAGNPNGLINRVGFGTASFIKQWSSWGAAVALEVAKPANFQIKIKNTFNVGSNSLNTDVTVKSLTNNAGTFNLVVLLTEDSIIAEQVDYSKPTGSQFISNYEFNHVLRGAINTTWGDAIFTTSANLNDSVVKSYTNYIINSNYRAGKCNVVAYVYDADAASPTHYEVFQAEEQKVK